MNDKSVAISFAPYRQAQMYQVIQILRAQGVFLLTG